MKFTTQFNYNDQREFRGIEVNNEPSKTQIEPIRSVRDILSHFTEEISKEPRQIQYFDAGDIDKINKFYAPGSLDFTDIDKLKQQVSEMDKQFKDSIKNAEAKKAAAEKAAAEKVAAEKKTT